MHLVPMLNNTFICNVLINSVMLNFLQTKLYKVEHLSVHMYIQHIKNFIPSIHILMLFKTIITVKFVYSNYTFNIVHRDFVNFFEYYYSFIDRSVCLILKWSETFYSVHVFSCIHKMMLLVINCETELTEYTAHIKEMSCNRLTHSCVSKKTNI